MAFALPFYKPDPIELPVIDTPLPAIQPFGLLVATGVLVGAHLMRRWGEKHDLDDEHVRGLVVWAVIVGFIGAHLFDVLAYQYDQLADDPLLLLKFWSGISSYGGIIGGVVGFLIYARRRGLPVWKYGDGAMIAFVPGFTFGRLACTVVHDHVGARSDGFFLAIDYPPGEISGVSGLHHNLGFYEFLYMLVLCGILYGLHRWKSRPVGMMVAVMATAYAPVRFFLEFLRVNPQADPRYAGLTFAQWMSIVTVAIGLYLMVHLSRRGHSAAEAAVSPDRSDSGTSGDKGKSKGAEAASRGSVKSGKGKSGKRRKKK